MYIQATYRNYIIIAIYLLQYEFQIANVKWTTLVHAAVHVAVVVRNVITSYNHLKQQQSETVSDFNVVSDAKDQGPSPTFTCLHSKGALLTFLKCYENLKEHEINYF